VKHLSLFAFTCFLVSLPFTFLSALANGKDWNADEQGEMAPIASPPSANNQVIVLQYDVQNRRANLEQEVLKSRTVLARITEYGWTGHKTASGYYPSLGDVATSDRSIAFGTRVLIEGKGYTVRDRTALWIQERFLLPTFDIYSETPKGLKESEVKIYAN